MTCEEIYYFGCFLIINFNNYFQKQLVMKKMFFLSAVFITFCSTVGYGQTAVKSGLKIPAGKIVSFNMSGNGNNAIVGVQEQDGKVKFWEFEKNNGKFGDPTENNVLKDLNDKNYQVSSPYYNNNATEIYFSADIDKGNKDIYKISKLAAGWGSPENLGDSVNTSADELTPAVSADGMGLCFARKNSNPPVKNSDCGILFFSQRTPLGQWSKPEELVDPINLGCETAPYISPDSKTIYISSIREGSKGGYDMYYIKRSTPKIWVLPISMDEINTEGDDMFPSFNGVDGTLTYFYKDPKKDVNSGLMEMGTPSKYAPEKLHRFYGKLTDLRDGQPIGEYVNVVDPVSARVLSSHPVDKKTGEYDFYLVGKDKYFLDFSAPGYSHTIQEISLDTIGNSLKQDISLFKVSHLILNVYDKDMFEPVSATITVTEDGKKSNVNVSDLSKGHYKVDLPIGKNYSIKIFNSLYEDYILDLNLAQVVQFEEFERDAELISEKELIVFEVSGPNEPVEIEITDLSTNEKYRTSVTTDENGKAKIYLRSGDKYEINISPKGYAYYNTTLTLDKNKPAGGYKVQAKLEALTENAKLEFSDITFETNSAELNASSYDELERLVTLLKDNPEIRVEISAHTDDVGADLYNLKLSDRRAASVANFLQNKGIAQNRLISKGYGKTRPIVPNNSDENRARNRRVEMMILGNN